MSDDYMKHTFGRNDFDFAPAPTLGQAAWAHPFQTILVIGAAWTVGAVVGRKKSLEWAQLGARKTGAGLSAAARWSATTAKGLADKADAAAKARAAAAPAGASNKIQRLAINGGYNGQ
jgi:hypothetical protein